MHDTNQGLPDERPQETVPPRGGTASGPAIEPERRDERGLLFWLIVVTATLPLSVWGGQAELGVLAALGGMFAVAHAVDRDPRWSLLHYLVAWLPPAAGVLVFGRMAFFLAGATLSPVERVAGAAFSGAAAIVSALLLARPVTDLFARVLLGAERPGHVARLGARFVVLALLLAAPGWLLAKALLDSDALGALSLGTASFAGSMVGFTLLALGAVGFLVGRDFRATLARLGLRGIGWSDVATIALGLLGLVLLNGGVEWVARHDFPAMFARDQAMNELIAGRLSRTAILMLGISAGVGEELAMRGALQPRLGLVMTSVLFAALHVQYSPIGMGTIAVIGMLLGIIRQRTSTTTAIAVHVLYDIVAALGVQQGG